MRRCFTAAAALLVVVGGLGVPAAAAPVPLNSWPQYGHDAQHTGTSPAEHAFNTGNITNLTVVSKAHFGNDSVDRGGPVVANGRMYIADFDGTLSVFATAGCGGRVLRTAVAGGATGSVTVSGGIAYVGDFTGHLHAFRAAGCGSPTCLPLWVGTGETNEHLGTPAVGNGNVYVTSFQVTDELFTGRLLVFPAAGCGATAGKPTWTADIGGPERGAEHKIFMASNDNNDGHSNVYTATL